VNNSAERNKYIHFELSKVLVHWFSAQIYPQAEKWFIENLLFGKLASICKGSNVYNKAQGSLMMNYDSNTKLL
jgi:hypothetical protein